MSSDPFRSVTAIPRDTAAADSGDALAAPLAPPPSLRGLLLTRQPRLIVTPRQWRQGDRPLEADEWTLFLARSEEIWRLRVRGLRDNDAAAFAEADARETQSVRRFSAGTGRSPLRARE